MLISFENELNLSTAFKNTLRKTLVSVSLMIFPWEMRIEMKFICCSFATAESKECEKDGMIAIYKLSFLSTLRLVTFYE